MPKELTHWHVAHEVLKQDLPPEVTKRIKTNRDLYFLGAIAHDIPFYDLSQPPETRIERIGNQLHGANGENTMFPLIEILEQALLYPEADSLVSFVLGMLTHYVADSTFHPLVYYLSGNYFDSNPGERSKAVFRHRLLETAIDLWLEAEKPLPHPQNLLFLWYKTGSRGNKALALVIDHYAMEQDKGVSAHFKTAWRYHRILQSAFKWSVPWRILSLYRRFGHPGVEKHEALFYPQPINLSFLDTLFEWRHPVKGDQYSMTLGQLYSQSVERAAKLFTELGREPLPSWPALLRHLPPLSLDTGLPYVGVKEMRFFSADPIKIRLRLK